MSIERRLNWSRSFMNTFKCCIHSILHEWTLCSLPLHSVSIVFSFSRVIVCWPTNRMWYTHSTRIHLLQIVKGKSLSKHFFCVDPLSQQRKSVMGKKVESKRFLQIGTYLFSMFGWKKSFVRDVHVYLPMSFYVWEVIPVDGNGKNILITWCPNVQWCIRLTKFRSPFFSVNLLRAVCKLYSECTWKKNGILAAFFCHFNRIFIEFRSHFLNI